MATYASCDEVVRMLIDNGAEVDAPIEIGYTPLQIAGQNGNLNCNFLCFKFQMSNLLEYFFIN